MDMTATTDTVGENTTLILEYTAPTSVMELYLAAMAKYDWRQGGYGDHGTEEEPIELDGLSKQEKLDLILQRVFDLGKAEAIAQLGFDATPDQATLDAIAEIKAM